MCNCPKGSPIRYGEVVARGDGFDEGANAFREMPDPKTIVAFEESPEEVEGHYFYIALRGVSRHPARLGDPVLPARVGPGLTGPDACVSPTSSPASIPTS